MIDGECAGDLLRAAAPRLGRRLTIEQSGEQLTVTVSTRGLSGFDSRWTGTVDSGGRITMTWQETPTGIPGLRGNETAFFCPGNVSRRVVLTGASATLSLSTDRNTLEGQVVAQSTVNDVVGTFVARMTDTAFERLTRQ